MPFSVTSIRTGPSPWRSAATMASAALSGAFIRQALVVHQVGIAEDIDGLVATAHPRHDRYTAGI